MRRPAIRRALAAGLLLAAALFSGCVEKPPAPAPAPKLTLTPARFAELAGWSDDHAAEALAALAKSCASRLKFADTAPVGPKSIAGTVADWRPACSAAARVPMGDDAAARAFFETWFQPYRCGNNGDPAGLFTGYYEPELAGSREAGGGYGTPLLKRPPDLIAVELGDFRPDLTGERIAGRVVEGKLKPYETRAEIEGGALNRYRLAFLWVTDPVAAFFLQIQGSGRVTLPSGEIVRVGYDGQNGRPYVAIGRVLADRGLMAREDATMPGIKAWLAAHPAETKAILDANPSYVFFREVTGEGPLGSEGVILTPGRSLAVDRAFLPLGVPLWLDAEGGLRRLMIAQDSGGAIRGPVRGDVFWGHGPEAEERAGTMRARGTYYLLLPKSVVPSA